MSDTPPTLMLIDGNSLTYRAFFALPADMATASGQVTNAVFGFTSMLINLLRDHPHEGLGGALDPPPATRPPARGAGVPLRPPRADLPPRAGRDLQGQPHRGARHPAPADGPRPPGDR